MAQNASNAVKDDDFFIKFFKSSNQTVRDTVKTRLQAVADHAHRRLRPPVYSAVMIYCDHPTHCTKDKGVIAFTLHDQMDDLGTLPTTVHLVSGSTCRESKRIYCRI